MNFILMTIKYKRLFEYLLPCTFLRLTLLMQRAWKIFEKKKKINKVIFVWVYKLENNCR